MSLPLNFIEKRTRETTKQDMETKYCRSWIWKKKICPYESFYSLDSQKPQIVNTPKSMHYIIIIKREREEKTP